MERADVSAKDFHVRVFGENAVGRVKLDGGVDVNGRFDLEAHDIGIRYDLAGAIASTTDNLSTEDARRIDAGLYLQAEVPAGRAVVLSGGARVDRVTTKNVGGYFGDRAENNAAFSGFASATAGVVRRVLGHRAGGARVPRSHAVRPLLPRPHRPRLHHRQPRPGAGDAALQFDGALRYAASRWRVAVYGYHYRIDDLVERYQTETDFFFFRNRGRARIRGVEAELQATLPWRLGLELTAHRLSGTALDDDAALDAIPVPTMTARLRRDFDKGYGWIRTALYGRLDEPGPTEQERPGLRPARRRHRGAPRLASVEIDLLGRNLLDKAYLVTPDARATLAPGPHRHRSPRPCRF